MSRSWKHQEFRFAAAGCAAIMLGSSTLAQCQYSVTLVQGPDCGLIGNRTIEFLGINDLGQACGYQLKCHGTDYSHHLPIVWTPEHGIILLPLPEGATQGDAVDINNVLGSDGIGQVACTLSFDAPIFGGRAAIYDDGTWTVLEPNTGEYTSVSAINDSSEFVGRADQAYIWRDGVTITLDLPMGPNSSAHGVSARSAVVGWMGQGGAGFSVSFHMAQRLVRDIPLIDNAVNSEAEAVNELDSVTGVSMIHVKSGPVPRRSWIFKNGTLTDLGMLPDNFRCIAEDINDAEQIAGNCFLQNLTPRPFIWQDGVMTRIDDLIPPRPGYSAMASANAINNRGQIAGRAVVPGQIHVGVILTPIVPLGDVNLDCAIDGDDLTLVLGNWGPDKLGHIADIVTSSTLQPPGDGVIDGADLAVVLGNWSASGSTSVSRSTRR